MDADLNTEPKRRAPRRDAQKRREALLNAATTCFANQGYDVPLEAIADQAGVGRGTLYRNFPDRQALAIAIFSREIDQIEARLDPSAPLQETIGAMVREGAATSSLFSRIAGEFKLNDTNRAALGLLRERLERAVEPVVVQAKARGQLDARVTARDVVLATRMLGGLIMPFMTDAELTAQIDDALRLLLHGFQPR
ncbi:TetR/AcrR family transcriptional regulator [Sphingomonas faeni]|uniref:TetR/AcrR family transcriptional regulator n=1 Tax=Sphingomonas faeni TaxID=185950 RepID=UPI00277D59A0|nr:TetR/AcrR family transcriptional regulator [Sphingomonas faeni]MDQ0839983.1 AcrR family transcriptional regulator [Sphingomonas faeni]